MAPLGYSGAQEKLIHEKNLQTKISCRTPFKATVLREFPNCGDLLYAVYLSFQS
jgi:hypothetical protein